MITTINTIDNGDAGPNPIWRIDVSGIADVARMTPAARALLQGATTIIPSGSPSLIGYVGRKAVWEAVAHFDDTNRLWRLWHIKTLGDGAMVPVWPADVEGAAAVGS